MIHISDIVYKYMVSIGGKLCGVCNEEWHCKNDVLCASCDEEARQLIAEEEFYNNNL